MARVLLVEDSQTQAVQIAGLLKKDGFDVVMAADGREAVGLLQKEQPDLVLTDLQMPDINGLQLVTALKQDFPALPIVLMTAHGSEQMAVEALRLGAASYVPKTALPYTISETLRDVLELSRARRDRQRVEEYVDRLEVEFTLENDPSIITPLVAQLEEDLCSLWRCDAPQVFQQMIALREALRNAMYHGNLELPEDVHREGEVATRAWAEQRQSAPPFAERRVHLCVRISRDAAEYVVTDQGSGFDPSSLPDAAGPAALDRPGARGLILISNFMDEVRHNEQGNQITMTKRRPQA